MILNVSLTLVFDGVIVSDDTSVPSSLFDNNKYKELIIGIKVK